MSSAASRTHLWPASTCMALAVVIVLANDASSWFQVLPQWAVAIVGACSALLLLGLALVRSWRQATSIRVGLALIVCLLALLALSTNRIVRAARLSAPPESAERQAMSELQRRASVIQEQFATLLARTTAPLEAARDDLASFQGGSVHAFDLLEGIEARGDLARLGAGISLYDALGHPLAWAGASYLPALGLLDGLPEGSIVYRVVSEPQLARLYGLLRAGRHVLVSETTVISRLDSHHRDLALPELAGDEAVILKLQDFREPETGFADLLARRDDRYPGGAAGERSLLFVGLRAPDRTFLGYVRLRGIGPSDMRRRLDAWHRDAAAIVVTAFLAALCLITFLPGRRPAVQTQPAQRTVASVVVPLAAGLFILWGGRALLSWFPFETTWGGAEMFDSTVFASAGLFHLLRSPGDLLLTTLVMLGSALIIARACGRLAGMLAEEGHRSRAVAAAGHLMLLGLLAGAVLAAPSMALGLVRNSAADLLSTPTLAAPPAVLALQASCVLALLAWFLMLHGCAHLAGTGGGPAAAVARLLPRPGDGLSRWAVGAFLPGVLVAAIAYDPLLSPPSQQVSERLFEDQLMPTVISQSDNRRSIVRASIEALEAMPDLPEKIQEAEGAPSTIALDLWMRTPLKDSGYNASLMILDPDGRTVSRFARNLPPAFDRRAPEVPVGSGEPMLERVSFLNLTKRIWHADTYVITGDQLLGMVTIHVPDDFDNIPFLIAQRPYARAFTPQLRRIMTLPEAPGSVRHAVYDRDGRPIFWNQREAPSLPADWTALIASPGAIAWHDAQQDGATRYLFFSDGDHVFALGFPRAGLLERAARAVRMSFIGLCLVAVMLVPVALVHVRGRVSGWRSRLLEALGRTHYRKLLVTFTMAALIPLLVLAALMSGLFTRELGEDIEDRGRQGIRAASSLVRTILETEERAEPDDDTLYWLSLLVGEDVNLYEHGELVATSRPELFGSGLLSPRIDGKVYRRLAIDGARFAMGRETLKGVQYRTITASVVADEGRWEGMLSLPLDAQSAEAVAAAREVADSMIITFVGMVFLLGSVAYLLARRLSRPIRSLRMAAARIAGGDLDAHVEARPRDETGELIATFNQMARAIREQREDLQRRKDYIEKILLNATIGVISLDGEWRIVTSNPAARAILGLPDSIEGRALADLMAANASLAPLGAAAGSQLSPQSREVELRLPPLASERTVRARFVPFLEGEGWILLLEDVTETVRSNRLAAWAEMARRIAHEIKNPLTPIQLSTEHIRRVYEEESEEFPVVLEECLRSIMVAVADLRRISAEFSAYARIPETRREPTDISDLIRATVRPYRAAPPPGVRVRVDVPESLPRLDVDRSLIARALVNLIENALQAMPRGGTLSVGASDDSDQVAIVVSDTGVGMEPADLARIFEPYFSTKDSGTGLGMAIARKAVEEHGGRIDVDSVRGKGTTMRVILPRLRGTPPILIPAEGATRPT